MRAREVVLFLSQPTKNASQESADRAKVQPAVIAAIGEIPYGLATLRKLAQSLLRNPNQVLPPILSAFFDNKSQGRLPVTKYRTDKMYGGVAGLPGGDYGSWRRDSRGHWVRMFADRPNSWDHETSFLDYEIDKDQEESTDDPQAVVLAIIQDSSSALVPDPATTVTSSPSHYSSNTANTAQHHYYQQQ
ncbi:hypothetical protein BD289DRAFT_481995 [Coniella lustricola]|uniref:Uncharacterized protein n=1 Tax=Coniella lustricola TaxID=2025994 RepID=A0A2T3AAH3_9PEZI|nr:hypothetical protein BD289DRAFT_481995 [Coniella lustricola]